MNMLLDQSLPAREFLRRPRPSDPWFDSECRQVKRLTRRLAGRWAAEFTHGRMDGRGLLPTPSPPPVPPLLRRHGTVSGVYIAFCDIVRALSFGAASSRLISQIQESCGDQWMSYSDVAVFLRALLSTSRRSTLFSLKRSRKYGPARKTHHRLLSVQRELE